MIESKLQSVYRRLFKPALWHRIDAGRRALPDFVVIGAMRCGTTSLHHRLVQHPSIVPALKKEIHFFDLEFERGARWYRSHFPHQARLASRGLLTGEASPYYLSHPLAARRAAEVIPDTRLIVVLRNPVDRAYSHYWHSVRLKAEMLSFQDAIEAEADRIAGESEKIAGDTGYRSFTHQHQAYLTRSHYADELETWFAQFPRKQFLILSREALSRDEAHQSERLFAFLGLQKHETAAQPRLNKASYPRMDPALRAELLERFLPHNERLFDLIGECFDWAN